MGHDLKTPLTSVVAAADALASEHPGSALAYTLKTESQRLRRVFDDLVEMTRIEAGALVVKKEAVDLTDSVASAAHDLRAETRTHKMKLDIPPNLPFVEADPRMLHHILVNLIDNAAKYSPEHSTITIAGKRMRDGVQLTIMDEGRGLPEGSTENLFQRFARVEGNDQKGGTGLGLAIVKGFADAMGLDVKAENLGSGVGAQFSILWPETLVRRGDSSEMME